MKLEITVPDELAKKFGDEALRAYLLRKLERLQELLIENPKNTSGEYDNFPEEDIPDEQNSNWSNFTKQRPAC